jgi:hypothetical protein
MFVLTPTVVMSKGAITALVIALATTIVAKMKRVAVVVTLALFLLWLLK